MNQALALVFDPSADDDQAAILSRQALALIDRPVITLDCNRTIVMINPAAESLIARSTALAIIDGKLRATEAPLEARLHDTIAHSIKPGGEDADFTYFVVHENERAEWHPPVRKKSSAAKATARGMVVFAAIGVVGAHGAPHCLLIASLGPPEPLVTKTQLRAAFGLTPTEASLAVDIARGLRPDEIVARRGVKAETIRVHVKAISAKMNCRGKNDIIRCVLALPRVHLRDDSLPDYSD